MGNKLKVNGTIVFDFFNNIIMLLVMVCTAYPFVHVVMASFSAPEGLARHTGLLLAPVDPISTKAYEMVLQLPLLLSGYRSTLIVLVAGVIVNMVLTILGAYFLSIKGPMYKDCIALMIVFTMYFSGGMIPGYMNVKDLGLLNSYWSLILPGAINTTNLIIMKSAFQAIPDSLIESAQLDGASYLQTLVKIMLPLTKATLAVLVLYYGVGHWNSWFNASIYLRDPDKYPLQLILRNMLDGSIVGMDEEFAKYVELIKYALIVISTVPILVLYPFLQRYFTKGTMIGAVKG